MEYLVYKNKSDNSHFILKKGFTYSFINTLGNPIMKMECVQTIKPFTYGNGLKIGEVVSDVNGNHIEIIDVEVINQI